jgi:hypothetical protein
VYSKSPEDGQTDRQTDRQTKTNASRNSAKATNMTQQTFMKWKWVKVMKF